MVSQSITRFCQSSTDNVLCGLLTPRQFHLTCVSMVVLVIGVFLLAFNMFLETSREVILRQNAYDRSLTELMRHRTIISIKVTGRLTDPEKTTELNTQNLSEIGAKRIRRVITRNGSELKARLAGFGMRPGHLGLFLVQEFRAGLFLPACHPRF